VIASIDAAVAEVKAAPTPPIEAMFRNVVAES
jgi:hypothetical protein